VIIKHLEIVNFRNHNSTELDFEPGISILVGENGQGKTNLVEAIRFISTLGSHRVAGYLPLIQIGKSQAVVRAVVAVDNREVSIELELNREGQNRASVNRSKSNKYRDVLGYVTTVTFAPEDLDIVKRDRSNRRDFMDELVIQAIPRMAGVYTDYNRVLKQRNSLLKSARQTNTSGSALSTLDAWDEQLARLGSEIIANRVALIAKLEPHAFAAYQKIATSNNEPRLTIESSVLAASFDEDDDELPSLTTSYRGEIEQMFHAKLGEVRSKELERGLTLIGPQRDELRIALGDLPAKGYASHGESWSLALALRLASVELLRENSDTGDPVLILDDVFAELDGQRRRRLAEMVRDNEQVLITAAVAEDVPDELAAKRFSVAKGVVTVG